MIVHLAEDRTEEARILTDAGFVAARREVIVEVDLDQALAAIEDAPPPQGVGVIPATDADLERLRILDDKLRGDVPGTAGWRSTPAEFAEETFDSQAFNPATYLVAVEERTGEYIGLVRIWMNRAGPRIGMFGVLRPHRRRGITLGLLARCLVAARELGHRKATSEFDETNEASKGVFERLNARQTGTAIEFATSTPAVQAPVFVISGQLASGKSTIARALLERYPLGYHVDVDGIREMVTSGLASPLQWTDETERQFDLALAASAALAQVYQPAGFAVAIEGGVDPGAIAKHLAAVGLSEHVLGIVLHPPLEVALARNRERQTKSYDTSILEDAIREIDVEMAAEPLPDGWHRIDNGNEPVETTIERILALLP